MQTRVLAPDPAMDVKPTWPAIQNLESGGSSNETMSLPFDEDSLHILPTYTVGRTLLG